MTRSSTASDRRHNAERRKKRIAACWTTVLSRAQAWARVGSSTDEHSFSVVSCVDGQRSDLLAVGAWTDDRTSSAVADNGQTYIQLEFGLMIVLVPP